MGSAKITKGLSSFHHVLMGVSLANRIFSRAFAKKLYDWVNENHIRCLKTVVFDEIEAINYRVFRAMQQNDATATAKHRGRDFQRMFNSTFAKNGVLFDAALESEAHTRLHPMYESILCELQEAYTDNSKFAMDVQTQVRCNLTHRIKIYGSGMIEIHMNLLVQYILKEIAFLETYKRLEPNTLEIYPGPNMMIKHRIWSGAYNELAHYKRPVDSHCFLDISFLKSDKNKKD